jgi:4-amino-4-deoxy-L-arabinose transferase-like glycosyltransferase
VLAPEAPKIAGWLEKRKYLLLILLTFMYLAGALGQAGGRPFWYDEIFTLIAAKSPDLATTWKVAVATDANPPLPHLLTHISIRLFGLNEVSARLPAIAGFWVLCLCLFRLVERRKGAVYGLCALLMPTLTYAYFYATEARAYGLELGFAGIALAAWQSAAEKRYRYVALPALALALACIMLCHYYGVLVYLPVAGAELWRAWRARRVDWGVWIALAVGGQPLVWRLETILGAVGGFTHTWAPVYLRQGLEFWEGGLAPGAAFAALFVGVLALARCRAGVIGADEDVVPEHEWVAGALLLAIPIAAVTGALLVTHTFTERYALLGLAGFCLLTPLVAAEFFGRRGTGGIVLLSVMFGGAAIRLMDHAAKGNPYENEPVLKEALEQGPVVIPDGQLFMQMWHYAPERLKPRLMYLADDAAALKYLGFDSIESSLRGLLPWAPVHVMEYREFAQPGREFLLYQNSLRPGWVLSRVADDGASSSIRKVALFRQLVSVRLRN